MNVAHKEWGAFVLAAGDRTLMKAAGGAGCCGDCAKGWRATSAIKGKHDEGPQGPVGGKELPFLVLVFSFTWKSSMLDMDSSDSFTLGFPLLLFPLAAPERSQAFWQTELLLYTHEFDPRLTSQNHFFLFLFFFFFLVGGAFFSFSIIT